MEQPIALIYGTGTFGSEMKTFTNGQFNVQSH